MKYLTLLYEERAIFINGFFKSNFFITTDISKYNIEDIHIPQILNIFKEHPETMIYAIEKFSKNSYFKTVSNKFFKRNFISTLERPFFEEQMYYFYAASKVLDNSYFKEDLVVEKVMKSNNQILTSYFIMLNYIDLQKIQKMLIPEEENWFLNYHIILRLVSGGKLKNKKLKDSIDKYLLPKPLGKMKAKQKETYYYFYNNNIIQGKQMIYNLEEIREKISVYLSEKIKEREELFKE